VSRERVRGLHDALREGAFAVLDQPLDRETLLEVLRRVLMRHYAGHWPD
jgi:DNA-binding NtrC family response regulator